jgi:ribosomal protein S18 acetylase RimI-like enzyme
VSTEDASAVTIRPLRAEDLPHAARLAAKLVRLHHSLDAQRFMYLEPLEPGYARFLGAEMTDSNAVVLVAEREGAIVGYAYGRKEGRDWMALRDVCGMIHDIWVEEEARGEGIGAKLVEAMIARLEALKVPRVVLSTAWQNAPAQELFAKLGFRPTMIEMTRERGG